MNIQKLISAVRKARKIRPVFLFHDKPRSGVDVPNEDWQLALQLLTTLFKHYKSEGCDIEISWWGEVFVTLPDYLTPFEISINHKPMSLNIDKTTKEAKEKKLSSLSNFCFKKTLAISMRPLRQRGKWKSFELDGELKSIGEKTLTHIIPKLSSYMLPEQHELEQFQQISTDDIIAVIRLGSVILGKGSYFQSLCNEFTKQIYIPSLTIENSSIRIKTYGMQYCPEYPLDKKAWLFLQKHLPIAELGELPWIVER
jgi:hypothetical protein